MAWRENCNHPWAKTSVGVLATSRRATGPPPLPERAAGTFGPRRVGAPAGCGRPSSRRDEDMTAQAEFEQVFEGFRKAGESTLHMQQELLRQWAFPWPGLVKPQ